MITAKSSFEKEYEITKLSSLLIERLDVLAKQYPMASQETLRWALGQAIANTSIAVIHTFEPSSTQTDQDTLPK